MSTQKTVRFQDLSPEQRTLFLQEAKALAKAEKAKKQDNYNAFKELTAEFIARNINPLLDLHTLNEKAILSLFKDFEPILAIRKDLYGDKPQDSYTSTLQDGSQSITIGYNVIISFDGTESEGVQKIKNYLGTLASDDDNAKKLSASLNLLLKPNGKTGMLKPNVVLQLKVLRDQYNNEDFDEGIEIIEKAQIFNRTTQYVRGWAYVNGQAGQRKKLTFSFSV